MIFLLVVFVLNMHSESLTTEAFSDKRSCTQAGEKINKWVEDNDERWNKPVQFTCIEVHGK